MAQKNIPLYSDMMKLTLPINFELTLTQTDDLKEKE